MFDFASWSPSNFNIVARVKTNESIVHEQPNYTLFWYKKENNHSKF
jgi:hypothetical protein